MKEEIKMKKTIIAILAMTIAASALAVCGFSASAEKNTGCLYGDADLDGKVSINDATLIQQAAIGLAEFTDTQKQLADVDGDGVTKK